jgi:hypothetical protein
MKWESSHVIHREENVNIIQYSLVYMYVDVRNMYKCTLYRYISGCVYEVENILHFLSSYAYSNV